MTPRRTCSRREWLDRLAEPGAALDWRELPQHARPGGGRLGWPGVGWPSVGRSDATWVRSGRADMAESDTSGPELPGATLADIEAVILAGGHARLASAERILREELQRPVIRLERPRAGIGARRGSVRRGRREPAHHGRPSEVEESSRCPGMCPPAAPGWSAGRSACRRGVPTWRGARPGPYGRRAGLRADRSRGGRAAQPAGPSRRRGRADPHRGGQAPASLLAGDPPGKRQELTGSGEWLFTPDRRVLVECAATAKHVRLWSIPDGVLLREFSPEFDSAEPRRGRVFVQPGWSTRPGCLGSGRAPSRSGMSGPASAPPRSGIRTHRPMCWSTSASGGCPRRARTPARPAGTAARWPLSGT